MGSAFGAATASELHRPDVAALAAPFGVPAATAGPDRLVGDLAAALAAPGPSAVVLPTRPRMFAPTHLSSGPPH